MELYIIAGPNGVGKTTFATEFLPNYASCKNFVNADLIAQGIAPFSPETAAVKAGRLMLSEIRAFPKRSVSFAFETTLSGKSYAAFFRNLKTQGYKIFFLCVRNADLALSRIEERVARGGHAIPETVVRSRFERSIRNFFGGYQVLADRILFDNSGNTPSLVASGNGDKVRIINARLYADLRKRCGRK
jgi:predicted ABC-type ATPase